MSRTKKASDRPRSSKKLNMFAKIWAIIYLIALLVFEFSLLVLDLLPPKLILIILCGLGVLSAIIFFLLFAKKTRPWIKRTAIAISSLFLIVFFVGANFSFGTMSFLGIVSIGESDDVKAVTHQPFNMYITGVDSWETIEDTGRSDVNMVATVNPETRTILLTSIPRDYAIRMVDYDYAKDKLTHTGIYGVETTISSVEDMLDIEIPYYVRVNFQTVVEFVDAIGGIDVVSDLDFSSEYGGTGEMYDFVEGENHLSGPEALAFARERKSFLDGDIQRIKNQQLVLEAILQKGMSSRTLLLRYNKVLKSIDNYIEMNLSPAQIRGLIKYQFAKPGSWKIEKNSITGHDGSSATFSGGKSYIMEQDEQSIDEAKKKINDVMNPPATEATNKQSEEKDKNA